MKKNNILAILTLLLLSACTSIQVMPLDEPLSVSHICIKNNPKVIVPGFLSVVRNGFEDHKIATMVFEDELPTKCNTVLKYTALRSWDIVAYLSHAELWLEDREGKRLAYAEYHLVGGGGLSLMKWASVKSKMTPVIDELLSGHK